MNKLVGSMSNPTAAVRRYRDMWSPFSLFQVDVGDFSVYLMINVYTDSNGMALMNGQFIGAINARMFDLCVEWVYRNDSWVKNYAISDCNDEVVKAINYAIEMIVSDPWGHLISTRDGSNC